MSFSQWLLRVSLTFLTSGISVFSFVFGTMDEIVFSPFFKTCETLCALCVMSVVFFCRHILPKSISTKFEKPPANSEMEKALSEPGYAVVVYLHGNSFDRLISYFFFFLFISRFTFLFVFLFLRLR